LLPWPPWSDRWRSQSSGKRCCSGRGKPAAITPDHESQVEINRDATLDAVQMVTGDVAQDYPRNL
jgi:hypothetical protein